MGAVPGGTASAVSDTHIGRFKGDEVRDCLEQPVPVVLQFMREKLITYTGLLGIYYVFNEHAVVSISIRD